MSKYPMVKLGDVFLKQINGEWGNSCENDGVFVIRTTNFTQKGVINLDNVVIRDIPKKKIEEKRIFTGDIILEKSGGTENTPVGRVVYCDERINQNVYLCNNFTTALRTKPDIAYSKYIFYFMWFYHKVGMVDLLQNQTTGIRNLQVKSYMNIQIPLPPLGEQRHIAEVLDKVTAQLDTCNLILTKLDLLVKAKFVQMFGDPVSNPMGWDVEPIKNIITDIKYGTSKPSTENGQYQYIRMNNITYDGHLDLTNLKRIDIPNNEIEKYIVRKGDVLFNRTNSAELVGKTCVFDLDTPMVIAGYIIRLRLKKSVLPLYFSMFMNTKYMKNLLFNMGKGAVNQANINAKELQSIKIIMPPIELQNEFAGFVQRVERQKATAQATQGRLNTLKQALMQRYFS